MGRENMEDYNAVFMTILETWEAAVGSSSTFATDWKLLYIAKVLRCHGAVVTDRRHRTWRNCASGRCHNFAQAWVQDQAIVLSRHTD